jgi:hypothetical protein
MALIKGNIKIIVIVVILPPTELPTGADLDAADRTREGSPLATAPWAPLAGPPTFSVGAPREMRVDGARGGSGRGGLAYAASDSTNAMSAPTPNRRTP